jgi:hypothetical protein
MNILAYLKLEGQARGQRDRYGGHGYQIKSSWLISRTAIAQSSPSPPQQDIIL